MEKPEMPQPLLSTLTVATVLAAPALAAGNPLLAPWTGAHGGVPPFDQVKVEQFLPAFEAAMAEKLAEIEAIAANPEAPTFANTIAALERSGRALDRVEALFGVFAGTMSTPEVQAVEREIAPRRSAHSDRIFQNAKLFERIAAVYAARESSGLDAEQQRLVWFLHNRFVRAGARLEPAA